MRHSRTDIIAETEKLNLLFDFMERELRRDDIDFQGAMLGGEGAGCGAGAHSGGFIHEGVRRDFSRRTSFFIKTAHIARQTGFRYNEKGAVLQRCKIDACGVFDLEVQLQKS